MHNPPRTESPSASIVKSTDYCLLCTNNYLCQCYPVKASQAVDLGSYHPCYFDPLFIFAACLSSPGCNTTWETSWAPRSHSTHTPHWLAPLPTASFTCQHVSHQPAQDALHHSHSQTGFTFLYRMDSATRHTLHTHHLWGAHRNRKAQGGADGLTGEVLTWWNARCKYEFLTWAWFFFSWGQWLIFHWFQDTFWFSSLRSHWEVFILIISGLLPCSFLLQL